MAWWDPQHRTLGASPRSKPRLVMGDAFPRLEPAHTDRRIDMERERALLSPVFEDQLAPPTTPALVVHVEIRFTDPVIRSRYCRSYGSSPSFDATNRMCRGLVRRMERCSEELLTRKDSSALDAFKGDTYERKPQRFELTFRVLRRGKGEWAERTYRSYQKQPLTVALTREIILSTHRIVGLFLRRHDENFRWLDCPVPDGDLAESEPLVPSRDDLPSLLSVPTSRFVEAAQTFESVPGYSIELRFRSRDPQRGLPAFEKRIKVDSAQTTPLTLFMSEDMLRTALQAVNQLLDSKKRELDDRLGRQLGADGRRSDGDLLKMDLRISNNLGPAYSHLHRTIESKLALFRDPVARDCDHFLGDIERFLVHIRDEADSKLNSMNDLEFQVVELKGVGWSLREPAKFTLGPSQSYGRRTIQAALERVQTGIGDVIRGHNIAIHIKAHKRGHLVLDKAIVAHEKRGRPRESFASSDEAQAVFVSRLKARIQEDMDRVFEDSCSIDDIPEDEEDYVARPTTPAQPEQAMFDGGPSPRCSPSSAKSSPARQSMTAWSSMHGPPRPRAQRVFSLSRRSTESMRSIDYLGAAGDPSTGPNSSLGNTASEQISEGWPNSSTLQGLAPLLAAAEVKPGQRPSSVVQERESSMVRVSSASTLIEEQAAYDGSSDIHGHMTGDELQSAVEGHSRANMTSSKELGPVVAQSGIFPARASPVASSPAAQGAMMPSREDECEDTPSAVSKPEQSKMDTPETFMDAPEYAANPVSKDIGISDLTGALNAQTSPREDDEFSTAPSTPELSTGGSSPSGSLHAGTDSEDLGMGLKSDAALEETSKGDDYQRPARGEFSVYAEQLGAEFTARADGLSHVPDIPTSEVRRSDPSKTSDHVSVSHTSTLELDLSPANGRKSSPEPESHAREAAGSELGAGSGAENTSVADNANPKPVPSESKATDGVNHATELETEDVIQDRVQHEPGNAQVPRRDAGPDTDNAPCQGDSHGVDEGSGATTAQHDKDQSAPESAISVDVGPANEAEGARSGADSDVLLLETDNGHSELVHGPGFCVVKPKSGITDKVPGALDFDGVTSETSGKDETALSGTVAEPERFVAEQEQKADACTPVPTFSGAEESLALQAESGAGSDGSEIPVEHAADGDIGSPSQDILSEPGAAAPELGAGRLLGGEDAKEDIVPVLAEAEITAAGLPGESRTEKTGREFFTEPPVANGTEAENAKRNASEEVLEGPPTDTTVTDPANTEISKQEPAGRPAGASSCISDEASPCVEADAEADVSPGSINRSVSDELRLANEDTGDSSTAEHKPGEGQPAISASLGQGLTGEAAETASESQPVNVSEELPQGPADQTNNIGQEASYEAGRVQDYIVLPTDEIVDNLNKLFSAPTQTNLRGDDGPSSITAEHIHSAPPPPTLKTTTPTSTSTSTSARRPQTAKKPPQTPIASYLGVGLRESRLVEVGLRGALGDVRARARARANANMRRLSLPPQHMLDRETMDALSAAGPASAPASDAGDGDHGLSSSLSSLSLSELGLRLGRWWEGDRDRDGGRGEDVNVDGAGVTGVRDVDGDGDGDGEGGAVPVLPRMMLLLATAMAVGKIMKSAAE
ncbi:61d090ca-5509-40ea-aece-d615eb1b6ba8 [Thermothielavioides terrestris]|uniref:61d090ca-5509-40ea-aece-d615eb1b6ba8 n=1 Tax=Thermothielavioides terrestris TaxID=2587410 RepID=A0A446B740_9PEZI|nr:61d090ca-5509-40ea-aece-d615eb1b6ba8 [Thermothielavioides terrestris]